MDIDEALDSILEHREQQWLQHCRFVLERLLIPICLEGLHFVAGALPKSHVVLVENRIDDQWLFTVLNTWLMCPRGTEFVLLLDQKNLFKGGTLLHQIAPDLKAAFFMRRRYCHRHTSKRLQQV